jgi:hypothetical protein
MKEWDRRRGERTGFNNSPGDCMAFKYLRDVSRGALVDALCVMGAPFGVAGAVVVPGHDGF